MANIILEDVSKKYGEFTLQPLNFKSKENEFIVILGPSGCGKSTLLRCIAGLEEISSGKVWVSGKDVSSIHPGERDMAMVFQSYALYPNLSVFHNIAFPLKSQRLKKKEIERIVKDVANKLEITHILNRKPANISGGERQRVAIAKAIIRKPSVFLFDEPLANLDVNLRDKARCEFETLHKTMDAVFVYVTHDQMEAMTLGDRIIVMNKGTIQQIGTPHDIYAYPANRFVAEFVGSPKMNFVPAKVYNELTGREIKDVLSSEVVLAIRPENVIATKNEAGNATVSSVKVIGRDTIMEVLMENVNLTVCARYNQSANIRVNDRVKCQALDRDFLYFDGTTGKRLCYELE